MLRIFAVIFITLVGPATLSAAAAEQITIFAAASMKDAMDRAVPTFEAQSGIEAVVSLAATSVLARQVEAGAPADIFISADVQWMDWLAGRGLVDKDSIETVAGNALVIVSSRPMTSATTPAAILREGRFAMGDPSHVPAGRYAKAALSRLGLWEEVRERAVFAENVRVALELARRSEVAAAIVYASDEQAAEDVSSLYTFPADSHPSILYFAAATAGAEPRSRAFLDFLASDDGQAIFRELGFAPPR